MKKQLHIELVKPAIIEYNYNKNLMIDLFVKLEEEQQNNPDKTPASVENNFWRGSNYTIAMNYLYTYNELARVLNIILKDKFKSNDDLLNHNKQLLYTIHSFEKNLKSGVAANNENYVLRKQDIEEYQKECKQYNEQPERKYLKNNYKSINFYDAYNYILSLGNLNDF